MSRKIDEINNGLHDVEKMLQQKSKNIEKAQEIQKVTSFFNFPQHLTFLLFLSSGYALGMNMKHRDPNSDPWGLPY